MIHANSAAAAAALEKERLEDALVNKDAESIHDTFEEALAKLRDYLKG